MSIKFVHFFIHFLLFFHFSCHLELLNKGKIIWAEGLRRIFRKPYGYVEEDGSTGHLRYLIGDIPYVSLNNRSK
jgi:hypothetical protein